MDDELAESGTDSEDAGKEPEGENGRRRVRYSRRHFLLMAGALVAGVTGVVAGIRRTAADEGAPSSMFNGPLGRPYGSFPINSVERMPPDVAAADWVVVVDGLVERPLRLDRVSWEALPRVRRTADFHCVEGWTAEKVRWEGVAPMVLLERAGLKPAATHVNFRAYRSPYSDSIPLELVRDSLTLIADRVEGQALPAEHGGPLRLVVSRQLGYKSVKWVHHIEVTDKPVTGYWEHRGYPMNAPIPS